MLTHKIYEWFRTHHLLVDAIAATTLWLVVGLLAEHHDPLRLLLSATLVFPLAFRRTRPVPAAAVTAAAALFQSAFVPVPLAADITVAFTVYSLAAFAPRWASLGGLGLAFVGAILYTVRYVELYPSDPIGSLPPKSLYFSLLSFMVLSAWTLGDLTRIRRLREQTLIDHARRLEIEHQQERALAASDERTHIAREMHDIIAHSLSVMITQADGARYIAHKDPTQVRPALETIAETGRSSLAQMRRLLGVLRGADSTSTHPLPTIDDIPALIDSVRTAGLPVHYTSEGTARRDLPPGAALTIYRVVQEALSNTLKHAGMGAHAWVRLSWRGDGLEITITDDGPGFDAETGNTTGYGIQGMKERVHLYEGEVRAGPLPYSGFEVSVFLPYSPI